MATYAIGDVHGQSGALAGLLAQVEPLLTPADTLVFLGDLIDRGPDARGCLEQVVRVSARAPCPVVTIRGNHEDWLLRSYRDPTRHSWLLGMHGLTTVESYSPEVAALLRSELKRHGPAVLSVKPALPYERFFELVPPAHLRLLESAPVFVRTADVVCVHGGARSDLPLEEQDAHSLIWGTNEFPDAYLGPKPLVYGHRNDGLVDGEGRVQPARNASGTAYGIDTIAQGVLTCLRFPDLTVFSAAV